MKKVISILATIALIVTSIEVSAYKEENLMHFIDTDGTTNEETTQSQWEVLDDINTNFISDTTNLKGTLRPCVITLVEEPDNGYARIKEVDANGNEFKSIDDSSVAMLNAASDTLPATYDARDKGIITSVKSQGALGTCWAHATAAAFETSMVKNGYEANYINYSETHLGYFCHAKDALSGDGAKKYESTHGYYGGGNPILATYYLENGEGMAYEAEYPYPPVDKKAELPEADRFISHSSIRAAGRIYNGSARNALTKQAIIDHGGVCIAYYESNLPLSANNAYYQSTYGTGSANHSVFVVGWDDNYCVDNFRTEGEYRPTKPGAWLVKGSYGIWNYDEGYLWISYEEPSLTDFCWFEAKPVENRVLHSYNGSLTGAYYTNYTANVFPVTQTEKITEIGFNTYSQTNNVSNKATFQLRLYDAKPNGPVDSGYVLAKQFSIDVTRDGFYRAKLPTALDVTAGQYISVVQKQTKVDGSIANHSVEYGNSYSSNEGESYICVTADDKVKDSTGKIITGWIDMHAMPDDVHATPLTYSTHNADMKLYGSTDTVKVNFVTRTQATVESQTLSIGDAVTEPPTPTLDGYDFLGWYSNTTATKPWDFSQTVDKDVTLYAKWSPPSNYKFVPWGRAFPYRSDGTMVTFGVIGKNIEKFDVLFYRNRSYLGRMSNQEKAKVGSFLRGKLELTADEYYAKAIVYGINGEEKVTEPVYFKVTTAPCVSKYGPYLSAVNMDTANLPLVIGASFNEDGVFEYSTTAYSPAALDVTAANYQYQVASEDINCNFFMWDVSTGKPLCVSSDTVEEYAQKYISGNTASSDTGVLESSYTSKVKSVPRGYFTLEDTILEFINE